jgi:hypothetical protein
MNGGWKRGMVDSSKSKMHFNWIAAMEERHDDISMSCCNGNDIRTIGLGCYFAFSLHFFRTMKSKGNIGFGKTLHTVHCYRVSGAVR